MYYQAQNTNKGQEATEKPNLLGKNKKYDSLYVCGFFLSVGGNGRLLHIRYNFQMSYFQILLKFVWEEYILMLNLEKLKRLSSE